MGGAGVRYIRLGKQNAGGNLSASLKGDGIGIHGGAIHKSRDVPKGNRDMERKSLGCSKSFKFIKIDLKSLQDRGGNVQQIGF